MKLFNCAFRLICLGLSLTLSLTFIGCDNESEPDPLDGWQNLSPWQDAGNYSDIFDNDDYPTNDRPVNYSQGLVFELSDDRTYMILSDQGTCNDTTITIPPTYNSLPVKKIKSGAFRPGISQSTPRVKEIIIPDSVEIIGADAFRSCEYLSKIHLGRGVKEIGDDAFYNCNAPLNIYINDLTSFCSMELTGTGITGHLAKDYNLYFNDSLVENLVIPNSVKRIGERVFKGCASLKTVTLGSAVTSIGENAFSGCKYLSEITLNSSLKSIGGGAFASCKVLMKVNFAITSGWCATYTSNESISFSSSDLSNSITAAKYLTSDYEYHIWQRH